MRNVSKRVFIMLLALVLALGGLPIAALAVYDVQYLDASGNQQLTSSGVNVKVITSGSIGTIGPLTGWYLVRGDITHISTLTVSGAAFLILEDGCDLTITGIGGEAGINVRDGNSLTIYAQSSGGDMGKLVATGCAGGSGGGGGAGIGGNGGPQGQSGGTITISGGAVTAYGGAGHISGGGGAGIGSGGAQIALLSADISGGTIIINGSAIVEARGGDGGNGTISGGGGAGIGSGGGGNISLNSYALTGGTIKIEGGANVIANGGNGGSGMTNCGGGAGIGTGGMVLINGGTSDGGDIIINSSSPVTASGGAGGGGAGGNGVSVGTGGIGNSPGAQTEGYLITAIPELGGRITPGARLVSSGGNVTCTITPDLGYVISDVLEDDFRSLGAVSSYTFSNITADHTIRAIFDISGLTADSSPTFNTTLTDKATGVSVTGGMDPYARLRVAQNWLHTAGACDACDEIRALHTLAIYDIFIAGYSCGPYRVFIPIADGSGAFTMLHCNNGKLERQAAPYANGGVTAEFSRLSPFAVVRGAAMTVPANIVVNPPKTGESTGVWGYVLLAAAMAGLCTVWRRRRAE